MPDAAADPGRVRRDFCRNLGHELRTPMNHILGYSELLLEEAADSGRTDLIPTLEQVHAAGKQTLALIDERLGASRLEAQGIDLAALRQALSVPLDAILAAGTIMQEQAAALGQEDLIPDLQRIDATPDARVPIQEGKLTASADYQGYEMGDKSVELAVRHLNGEKLTQQGVTLPSVMVDTINAEQAIGKRKQAGLM